MTRKNRSIASLAFQERRAKREAIAKMAKQKNTPKEGKMYTQKQNTTYMTILIIGVIIVLAVAAITAVRSSTLVEPTPTQNFQATIASSASTLAAIAPTPILTPIPPQ